MARSQALPIRGTFISTVIKLRKSVEYRVRGLVIRPLEIENPFLYIREEKKFERGV